MFSGTREIILMSTPPFSGRRTSWWALKVRSNLPLCGVAGDPPAAEGEVDLSLSGLSLDKNGLSSGVALSLVPISGVLDKPPSNFVSYKRTLLDSKEDHRRFSLRGGDRQSKNSEPSAHSPHLSAECLSP